MGSVEEKKEVNISADNGITFNPKTLEIIYWAGECECWVYEPKPKDLKGAMKILKKLQDEYQPEYGITIK